MQKLKTTLLLGFFSYIPTTHGAAQKTIDLKKKDAKVVYIKSNVDVDFGTVYYFDGQTDNKGNPKLSASDDGPPSGVACHYMQKESGKLLFIRFSQEGIETVCQSDISDLAPILISIALQKDEPQKATSIAGIKVLSVEPRISHVLSLIPASSPPRAQKVQQINLAKIVATQQLLTQLKKSKQGITIATPISKEEGEKFENLKKITTYH